ncbi:MAG TPA: EamA family transporter [Acidobacteriaceae bacterium]|nr:EamA family transporter [Acidobacteriaceae bacterium]
MSFRRYLVLAIVTLTASCGDTFLARGMKTLPPVSLHHPLELIHAIFSPWVAAGIVLLIGFFASYLTALSFADLTYVLPATSLGYVIMTILAHWWLHEHVSPWRWLGVLCITAGVGFVTRGPAYTNTREPEPVAAEPAAAKLANPQEVSR